MTFVNRNRQRFLLNVRDLDYNIFTIIESETESAIRSGFSFATYFVFVAVGHVLYCEFRSSTHRHESRVAVRDTSARALFVFARESSTIDAALNTCLQQSQHHSSEDCNVHEGQT